MAIINTPFWATNILHLTLSFSPLTVYIHCIYNNVFYVCLLQ